MGSARPSFCGPNTPPHSHPEHLWFLELTACPAGGNAAPQAHSSGIVSANSRWADIREAFGAAERATLHARSLQAGPQMPSYVVGYRGVAFEVTKAGYIASATLFIP